MKPLLLSWLLLVCFPSWAAEVHSPSEIQVREDATAADAWRALLLSHVDPQQRLIWVRVRFVLPASASFPARPLGLYVAGPAAYEAWWNGVYIGRNGIPGPSKAAETPGRIDSALALPDSLLRAGENVALLKMSSFHLPARMAAPMQIIELREMVISPFESLRQDPFRMMAAGALLLGAVYFGALYLSNRQERSALWLTLLSLTVLGQLAAESIRSFVSYVYPFHFLRLTLILAFAALSMLLLVFYVAHRYAPAHERKLLGVMALFEIACIALLPGFQLKTAAVLLAGFLVAIVAATIGLRRDRRDAVIALPAIVAIFVMAGVHPYRFVDRTYYLAIGALLLMLFAQHVVALRREQRAQAETRLRAAHLEIELLRQQIQPHFLMNTLTALCEWIESDPQIGMKMIEALGDELRAIGVMGEAATVPLRQEVDLCRHHLRVMSFQRNKTFTLVTREIYLDTPVPPAVFHTLVENSLTHNAHAEGAEFALSESVGANGRRRYELRTPLRSDAPRKGAGKGHAYIRARLQHAFGDNWHFSSEAVEREWLDVVEVPSK